MFLQRYKFIIVAAFISVFVAKIGVVAAPIFYVAVDRNILNAVMQQLELSHEGEKDDAKETLKFLDFKSAEINYPILSFAFIANQKARPCNFWLCFKRYITPYHASVPTPPPNLA